MVDPTPIVPPAAPATDADKLLAAVESAGFVHPEAPAGFPTPGHALAAQQAASADPVGHLAEIAQLADQARTASQSGVETISAQILAHVQALQAAK